MDTKSIWNGVTKVIAFAAILGVLADLLLRESPWGLNAALWSAAFAAVLWHLCRDQESATPASRLWCIPFIALFGAMLAWRDAPTLKFLNIAAMFLLCATLILRPGVDSLLRSGFVHYLTACVDGAMAVAFGLPLMATSDVPLQIREARTGMDRSQASSLVRHVWSTAIGMLIAAPLLLVFGALFTSADTAFREWMRDLFHLDWQTMAEHAVITGVVSWSAAGYLHVAFLKRRITWSPEPALQAVRLDTLAILIPLGSLIALFGAFIAVQVPHFFGGDAIVRAETGPSYAEYARQGFFQLVTVATLALAVLLTADWLGRDASAPGRRALRWFTAVLVTLVFVVMASALHRMALYTSAYGLTTLRFYTTAFMFWLAAALAWFLAVMLRGQRERFLFPALVGACVAVMAFNAVNPERIIVQVNTSREGKVNEFDIEYLITLSNDATPALVALSDRLPEFERGLLREPLERRIDSSSPGGGVSYNQRLDIGGWRAWSLSRQWAGSAIQSLRP